MKNIIIDCDTGSDDALALMLATEYSQLNILGVTTVSGNTHCDIATQNTLDVLRFCKRCDVKVYHGANTPIERSIEFTDEYCGKNGICDYIFPHSHELAQPLHAVDFLYQSAVSCDELTIISTAPFTNLALLIKKYPDLPVDRVTIVTMAGYYKVNDYKRRSSEWNVLVDPEAYKIVVDTGVKIVALGADVTSQITNEMFDDLLASDRYFSDYLLHCKKFYLERGLTPLSLLVDAVPVAYVIDNKIANFYNGNITVTINDKIDNMIIDFDKNTTANNKVAYDIDLDMFLEILKNNKPKEGCK